MNNSKPALCFRPSELINELVALRALAEKFIDSTTIYLVDELRTNIEGLRQKGRGEISLTIPETRPLCTRISAGEFEPFGKTSSRRVVGKISGIWAVKATADTKRPAKKARPEVLVNFCGKASAKFEIVEDGSGQILACWKMELGAEDAPGCFFHTYASTDEKFPVPRHPNIFVTPMSCIEFALSELFQTGWAKAVSGTSDPPNRWRSIQKQRFRTLLKWQLGLVEKTTSSPWCDLKLEKPEPSLFL